MNCFSDANTGRIHRWAPLDEKTTRLVRWHWASGRVGHLRLSRVMGTPWGLHRVMTMAHGSE